MKTIAKILSISVTTIALTIGNASATELRDVLVYTYNTNPALLAERENLKATDELYYQAFAGFMPSASLNYGRENDSLRAGKSAGITHIGKSQDFIINQPIFNGGQSIAQMHRAMAQIKAEQAQLKITEQKIFLNAIAAYMDVVRNEEILKLSEENIEALKKNQLSTNERFKLGEVTRTDLSQSDARVSRAISDRTRTMGDLTVSRATFKNVTGMEAINLKDPERAKNLPSSSEVAILLATQNSPNIVQAENTLKGAKSAVSQNESALLPSVSLRGDYRDTTGFPTLGSAEYDTKSLALNVSIPLYQSGSEYSRIRASKDTVEQQKKNLEQTIRDVTETAVRAWQSMQVSEATLKSSEDAVNAAKIALAGVTQEAEIGSRTVTELLDAEQQVYQTETEFARAKHDAKFGSYQVLATIGNLTAKDLGLPVTYYNPKLHLDKVKYLPIGF